MALNLMMTEDDELRPRITVFGVGGAGGNIGTGQAARAAPDGHTVLMVAPSFSANPPLCASVPYDPEKSFDAVTLATTASTAAVGERSARSSAAMAASSASGGA